MRRVLQCEDGVRVGDALAIARAVSRSPQLVVKMHHAFERPGRGFGGCRCRYAAIALHIREECLHLGAEILQMRRVGLELFERLLVHQPQCMSFAAECFFERSDSEIDVRRRRRAIVRLPLMKRKAETIQLSLESRQALFETWIVVHRGSWMMIHKICGPASRCILCRWIVERNQCER